MKEICFGLCVDGRRDILYIVKKIRIFCTAYLSKDLLIGENILLQLLVYSFVVTSDIIPSIFLLFFGGFFVALFFCSFTDLTDRHFSKSESHEPFLHISLKIYRFWIQIVES